MAAADRRSPGRRLRVVLHSGSALHVVWDGNDYGDAILAAQRYDEEGFEVADTMVEGKLV